jgi:glycosyltransferase involved in cell wall biosynthesis
MNEVLPVSVCIVARNEEKNLPRLLASVSGWVSEIVLVLNQTTDSSEDIAVGYGARVEHRPWIGYRDTKNVALELASQPWVLALDADEEVSVELKTEICGFFSTQVHEKYAGARFPRKSRFLGRWILHGDWYPDRQLRLFRKGAGRWGGSPEHDKIELQGACWNMSADLLHFSNPSIASYIGKINVFSDYFLRRQLEKGARWSVTGAVFRACWRFVRAYLVRLGFLDGFPGLFIATSTAYSTFVRYSRMYEHVYSDRQTSPAEARDGH